MTSPAAPRPATRRTGALPRVVRHAALLALGTLLATSAPRAGEIVLLRDGSRVHGEIIDFDEATGFTIERADTGGVLRLRWEHLPPAETTRIKASRGFTGEAPEPYLVDVVHLLLKNGTTETGVAVEGRSDDVYTLRRLSGTDSFPKRYVRSVETGRLDGLAVYEPDELYRMIAEEAGPPQSAVDHLNLAVACEGAGLYEQAGVHYEAVAAADPDLKAELVASRLARIAVKLEDEVETRQLDEIRNRLYRRQYTEALAMVDAFREAYPLSRQLGDAAELEVEIRDRKRAEHGRAIVSDYFSQLEKRLRTLSRDETLTLDVARESLEDLLHDAILDDLGAQYELTDEAVLSMWAERSGASVRTYSYGTGTFILGPQKALDFGRFEDEEEASQEGADELVGDEDFEQLVEKVKAQRAKTAAQRQAGSPTGGILSDEGLSPDDWWSRSSSDERFKWLMAYFAEFGGSMHVIEARGRPCRLCNGWGYLDGVNELGEPVRNTCTTCKGLKSERFVRYR